MMTTIFTQINGGYIRDFIALIHGIITGGITDRIVITARIITAIFGGCSMIIIGIIGGTVIIIGIISSVTIGDIRHTITIIGIRIITRRLSSFTIVIITTTRPLLPNLKKTGGDHSADDLRRTTMMMRIHI